MVIDDAYFIPISIDEKDQNSDIKFIDCITALNKGKLIPDYIKTISMNDFSIDNTSEYFIFFPAGSIIAGEDTQDRVIWSDFVIPPKSKLKFGKALCGNMRAGIRGKFKKSGTFLPFTRESGNPLVKKDVLTYRNETLNNHFNIVRTYSDNEEGLSDFFSNFSEKMRKLLKIYEMMNIVPVNENSFKINVRNEFFKVEAKPEATLIEISKNFASILDYFLEEIQEYSKGLLPDILNEIYSVKKELIYDINELFRTRDILERLTSLLNQKHLKRQEEGIRNLLNDYSVLKYFESLIVNIKNQLNEFDEQKQNIFKETTNHGISLHPILSNARDNFVRSNPRGIQSILWTWIGSLDDSNKTSIFKIIKDVEIKIIQKTPEPTPNEIGMMIITPSCQYNMICFPNTKSWLSFRDNFVNSYFVSQEIKSLKKYEGSLFELADKVRDSINYKLSFASLEQDLRQNTIQYNRRYNDDFLIMDGSLKDQDLREFLFLSINGFFKEEAYKR